MQRKYLILFLSLALLGVAPGSHAQEEFFSRQSSDYESIVVEKVYSADTIRLENTELIRLIGLKAPKAPKPKKQIVNEYGIVIKTVDPTVSVDEKAFNFAKELLQGKTVRLEFDAQKTDEEFYTLAYVFLPDGTMANEEILRQGFAQLKLMPLNNKYSDLLREAYQEARREKRGLQGE